MSGADIYMNLYQMMIFRYEINRTTPSQSFESSNLVEKIFTPIRPTAKCPHGEKYGEMSHGEMSHNEKSYGELS